jgi:FkbM family methyltransferase
MIGKELTKDLFKKLGLKLSRLTGVEFIDNDNAFAGIHSLMNPANKEGVFFDVGANTGQTISNLQRHFPKGKIYAFDPGKTAFENLHKNYSNTKNVHIENIALGSQHDTKEFFENEMSTMSSFLQLGKNGWGSVISQTKVNVTTVDLFCSNNNISSINLLKSDTQGFELEVLKGSKEMLANNKIQFIYLEINFVELYKKLPSFCDIQEFLLPHGFKLMRLYDISYYENSIGWADVLYYNSNFVQQ